MSKEDKILYLPIKREWFEKIERGEKTVEYRAQSAKWNKILKNHYTKVVFRNGYGREVPALEADIKFIVTGLIADKPELAKVISTWPYAWEIHFEKVRRVK